MKKERDRKLSLGFILAY